MADIHPACLSIPDLLKQVKFEFARRSGPGGQHRNKVETAIEILYLPTGTTAQATERRSQHENKKVAFQRLRVNLAIEVRSDVQRDQAVSSLWRSRTSGGKVSVSRKNEDYATQPKRALKICLRPAMKV